jgi:hypothetical protein
LPDDLDLDAAGDGQEESPDAEDDPMDEDELEERSGEVADSEFVPEEGAEALRSSPQDESPAGNEDDLEGDSLQPPQPDGEQDQPPHREPAVVQPDLSPGDGQMGESNAHNILDSPTEDRSQENKDGIRGSANATAAKDGEADEALRQGNRLVFPSPPPSGPFSTYF